MRGLRRNKRTFWYCPFLDTNQPGSAAIGGIAVSGDTTVGDDSANENRLLDEDGFETGEIVSRYGSPVKVSATVTSARGQVQTEPFGTYEDYDKIIVTAWTDIPIDENSVLFLDKEPEFQDVPAYGIEKIDTPLGGEDVVQKTYRQPVYDYRVTRVSRGLNGARIFAQKVAVT